MGAGHRTLVRSTCILKDMDALKNIWMLSSGSKIRPVELATPAMVRKAVP